MAVAFAIIVLDKNQNLACAAAILAAFGISLVLIAVMGTLLGMIARKVGKEKETTFHAIIDPPDNGNSVHGTDKENR